MMSVTKKAPSLYSDAAGTLAVRGIGILLTFASTTLLARLLGPEEYGTYSAALSLALLMATFAPVGSDQLMVRNLSTVKCPQAAGHETAIAHLCTVIVAMLLLAASLGSWFLNRFVLDNMKWAQTSLMASIMFIPLTMTYLRQWAAIPIIGSRRAVMPEQMFLPLIFSIAILLIAGFGWMPGAATTATTYAVVMVFILIISLQSGPIWDVYQSAWKALANVGRPEIRQQFRDGIPFVSVGIGSALSQRCMPLIIAMTCGFEETAYFALAFPFASLATIPLGAINLTMIPRCARHYKQGEFAEANHAVRSTATASFLLAAFMSITIWIASPLLILLLGSEYTMLYRLLPPMMLGVIADCLTGPTIPVMQTMKMEKTYSRALMAFIPVQLCLVYMFGRVAGVEGTACAYFASRCLWNLIVATRIYQLRGLTMLPYLRVLDAIRQNPPAAEAGRMQPRAQTLWMMPPPTESPARSANAA